MCQEKGRRDLLLYQEIGRGALLVASVGNSQVGRVEVLQESEGLQ